MVKLHFVKKLFKKKNAYKRVDNFFLDDHFKYKKGYVLNTGINIWGLDFVPKLAQNESDRSIQYLAVSGYRGSSEEHIGMNEIQPTGTYLNSIQIWKLKLSVKQKQEEAVLDLCLLHDFGVIFDLQWCPYGAYEEEIPDRLPKLGILSFVAGDGTTRTVVVPHPDAVRRQISPNGDPKQPVYSKYPPPFMFILQFDSYVPTPF